MSSILDLAFFGVTMIMALMLGSVLISIMYALFLSFLLVLQWAWDKITGKV